MKNSWFSDLWEIFENIGCEIDFIKEKNFFSVIRIKYDASMVFFFQYLNPTPWALYNSVRHLTFGMIIIMSNARSNDKELIFSNSFALVCFFRIKFLKLSDTKIKSFPCSLSRSVSELLGKNFRHIAWSIFLFPCWVNMPCYPSSQHHYSLQ